MSTKASELVVNDALKTAIASAVDAESIKQAILAEATAQGIQPNTNGGFAEAAKAAPIDQIVADKTAADAAAKAAADAALAAAEAPKTFTRTEKIGKREFEFEAETEAELDQMILNAYRVASEFTSEPQPIQQEVVVDQAALKAAQDAETARLVDLELKFKRGDIKAKEYLEQSGAINEYLKSQGVPVDDLKQIVEQRREDTEAAASTQSWAQAVERFLVIPGNKWPGGDKNLKQVGIVLQNLGLEDAADKVAALNQAFAYMQQQDLVFENKEAATTGADAAAKAAADAAKATADAAAAAAATQRTQQVIQQTIQQTRQSSSVFGASSGTQANDMRDRSQDPPPPAAALVPKDATPQEIMEAYKASIAATGADPNTEFINTFKTRK